MSKIRCIIPCAGYGTRMGMKPNKSKEMLPDPDHKRQPIIKYSIDLCKIFNLEPIVITREDKKDLRQWLFNNQVEFIDIKVEGEWYDTVMKSVDYWEDDNILLLPDTRFSPLKCLQDVKDGLKLGNESVFAMHKVTDPEKWGIIKDYYLTEKPKDLTGTQWAWGVIGFKAMEGHLIFQNLKEGKIRLEDSGFTFLKEFKDITRGKK